MNPILRNLLLLAIAGLVSGAVWAGENRQTIEQTEWSILGQHFDDVIARQIEWRKEQLKAVSEPKQVLLLTDAIAKWSAKEPPPKLHCRLGRVNLDGFLFGDSITKRLQPELEKDTFDSLIARNKEVRQIPLGQLTTPLGKMIPIVNEDANSRKPVFVLSRVGFSRDGRQAIFSDRFAFYLYRLENGRWKQARWLPYAVD
jgi:hypothetical protein